MPGAQGLPGVSVSGGHSTMQSWAMLVPGMCLAPACFIRGFEPDIADMSQTLRALTGSAAPLIIVWLTDLGSVSGLLLRGVLYLREIVDG